eukprot:Skav218623  [mRNA]  locus=scaffold3208:162405:163964:- [translate_table: standard]
MDGKVCVGAFGFQLTAETFGSKDAHVEPGAVVEGELVSRCHAGRPGYGGSCQGLSRLLQTDTALQEDYK